MVYMRMASWRLPQGRAVDAVRWLPSSAAAWDRMLLSALFEPDSGKSSVELNALRMKDLQNDMDEDGAVMDHKPRLELSSEWTQPGRVAALGAAAVQGEKSVVVSGSIQGSVGIVVVDAVRSSMGSEEEELLVSPALHEGTVCGVDVQSDLGDCLSVGEDGKINLVKFAPSGLQSKRVHDSSGFVSFSAVHWASPMEFVTAGMGAPLQWWDLRRPNAAVSQCHLQWDAPAAGFVHSLDVHPSRKHLCVVGGSAGSVFAWDLRWQQDAIRLAGVSKGQSPIVESEVWEVRYDHGKPASSDSGKIPPVMICSEDGVLAVIEGGGVTELLAEPCAINSFDIDPENGKDIICGLEYESILYLSTAL